MPRLWLLVALPALHVRPIFLVGRQPVHPVLAQNAMHRRSGHAHLMKASQIVGNAARPEVIALAEVEDLADDRRRRGPGRAVRRPGSITQARRAVRLIALLPLVERLA